MNPENIYTNELIKKINPTVLTAGSSLFASATAGDPDSKLLAAELMKDVLPEKEKNNAFYSVPEKDKSELIRLSQAVSAAILTRYRITNRLFEILKMTTFMDIGCGFTQRGIELSKKKGTTYYGIDLPSVTERMIPAVTSVIGAVHVYNRITYHTADATDLNALRSVIHGRSPLFISTEGLMMYLTVPEAISVTDNICSLLEEFGGVWVTADPEMSRLNETVINSLYGEDAERMNDLIEHTFGKSSESNIYSNGLTSGNGANADVFLKEHGFDVRCVPAADLLDGIELPDNNLKEIYKNINFRIMTSKVRYEHIRSPQRGGSMTIETERQEEQTVMRVSGRIDTVTAPEFIKEYQRIKAGTELKKLVIDMGNVIYVSSAGIRALLMIFKELSSSVFSLANLTPEVSEIFHTTGLSDTL